MNIVMVGIDHNLADIEIREKFSFTNKKLEEIYEYFKKIPEILGSVIISTCNRSEVYFSLEEESTFNPFEALCYVADANFDFFKEYSTVRTGSEVFMHLSLLSCGAKSKIWGEDQIISQVKTAILKARENHAADGYLEVLFRFAITAAKEIKTKIKFGKEKSSVAYKVIEKLENTEFKRVLVIGNGEIGRLVASLLIKNNFETTMTLRQYKHTENIVPDGCFVVNYEKRYTQMELSDIVVSATLSPHHTVEFEEIQKLKHMPKIFFDLAVPRDIDPKIKDITDVEYYNIDNIGDNQPSKTTEIQQAVKIIEKQAEKLRKWCVFKERVEV